MAGGSAASVAQATPLWQWTLRDRLALYGHRNWIVIADSAYPAQARPGIEIIASEADQLDVLGKVVAALAGAKHVRPIVYTVAELRFVVQFSCPHNQEWDGHSVHLSLPGTRLRLLESRIGEQTAQRNVGTKEVMALINMGPNL